MPPKENFLDKYYTYFTLAVRSPFDENSFMFSGFMKFIDNATHEIMHIEFLRAYKQYCYDKGLTGNQLNNLKEILTVLLNIDMADILTTPDKGYTNHQELRQYG